MVAVEAAEAELRGINSRAELAVRPKPWCSTACAHAAMEAGATLTAPETVYLQLMTQGIWERTRWWVRMWCSAPG